MAAIDAVNALADAAPGFVWRLEDDDDEHPGATGVRAYEDPWLIVNLSVWESREALWDFAYGGGHLEVMRRRREWFSALAESHLVLWWVPAGEIPSVEDAVNAPRPPARPRPHGSTPKALDLRTPAAEHPPQAPSSGRSRMPDAARGGQCASTPLRGSGAEIREPPRHVPAVHVLLEEAADQRPVGHRRREAVDRRHPALGLRRGAHGVDRGAQVGAEARGAAPAACGAASRRCARTAGGAGR